MRRVHGSSPLPPRARLLDARAFANGYTRLPAVAAARAVQRLSARAHALLDRTMPDGVLGCDGADDVIVGINRADSARSVMVPAGSYTDLRTGGMASGGSVRSTMWNAPTTRSSFCVKNIYINN